jgi:hypothetical protein
MYAYQILKKFPTIATIRGIILIQINGIERIMMKRIREISPL